MPTFEGDDIRIYDEEYGQGFPVLLIAPGGMRSAISFWEGAPWSVFWLSTRRVKRLQGDAVLGKVELPLRQRIGNG